MAVVSSAEEETMSEEHRQDRAQRALQVAVVAGFMADHRGVLESCLGFCNACRDGVPLECLRVGKEVPPTLLAMVLPSASQAPQKKTPPTRVLQPRRVLKVQWIFNDELPDQEDGFAEEVLGLGDVDVSEVQWPEGTKEIILLRFNRTVNSVVWPVGLHRLSFCLLESTRSAMHATRSFFNHPLQGVIFPSGLREIFLGEAFNQPIDDVVWPQGLERISLPGYNHPIDNVGWPPALKSLEFMPPEQIRLRKNPRTCIEELNLGEGGLGLPFTKLPASLETLWLSDGFSQYSLEDITWPPGLVTIGLGRNFDSFLTNRISWPSSLRHIYSLQKVFNAPQGCVVTVVKDYDMEEWWEPDTYYDTTGRVCLNVPGRWRNILDGLIG